mgnify:CR=1 FL=1
MGGKIQDISTMQDVLHESYDGFMDNRNRGRL